MSKAQKLLEKLDRIKVTEASDLEPGLEIKKKSKLVGKLVGEDPADVSVVSIEKLPPGDPMQTCDNCGRQIRHICHLSGGYDVGPDCAITLDMPGASQTKVKDYVKKATNVATFVRNNTKKIGSAAFEEPREILNALSAMKKAGFPASLKMLLSRTGRTIMLSKPLKLNVATIDAIRNYTLNLFYKHLLEKEPEAFKELMADAHGDKDSKKKDFWFDANGKDSIFYDNWIRESPLVANIGNKEAQGNELTAEILL